VPTATARVPTDRADRYLAQLCQHLGQIGSHPRHGHGGASPQVRRVDRSDGHGTIEFAAGTCMLHASADELTIELTAVDAQTLEQLQRLLSARLETIGRRDNFTVTW
jgi:hypothetical protein